MADMREESQRFPLAPFEKYQRSDKEIETTKTLKQERTHNKCFIYVFTTIVLHCVVLFALAFLVLRVKTPSLTLHSISLADNNYHINLTDSSSSPHNISFVSKLCIENPNYGPFEFGNGSMGLFYEDSIRVGEGRISEGRAKVKGVKWVSVFSEAVLYRSDINTSNGDHDQGLMLKFRCFAKLIGKVRLIKILKKRRVADMNCVFSLNLKLWLIQDLVCNS